MASSLNPLPPLPPPLQPVIEANGRMNREWYLYFQRLDQHLREAEQRLTAGGL
jgi:hypothetical protein